MGDYFEAGQWQVVCDRCGFEYKARQLRVQWNQLRCCSGPGTNGCWEPRNVQEKVRGKSDREAPPWVRPAPPDIELTTNQVQASNL